MKTIVTIRIENNEGFCEAEARVQGTDNYCGIIRGSTERRSVVVAGHHLEGRWSGDARRDTEVVIGREHPLADAVRLIARAQQARRNYLSLSTESTPRGWSADDWRAAQRQDAAKWAAAAKMVQADSVAAAIVAY